MPSLVEPCVKIESFMEAVQHGDVGIVNTLLEQGDFHPTAEDYHNALQLAAEKGHLPVINRLLEIGVIKNDFIVDALLAASEKGHLLVVNRLLAISAVQDAVTDYQNAALRLAAENGHLLVVNRLLEISAVQDAAAAYENHSLSYAARNGHLLVVNRLLEIGTVRNAATAFDNLALLWAAENGHLSVVNRLLEIDAVRNAATTRNNKVLREAQMRANGSAEDRARYQPIVDRLLQIPEVAARADQQSQQQVQHGQQGGELADITRFSENSMMSLSPGELTLLDILKGHYKDIYETMQWEHLRDDMLHYLEEAYAKDPAKDEQGNALPLHYTLNQNEEALKAYYKHNIHTAWRYLSHRNPWMAPDAQHVQRFENGEGAAVIAEAEQAIIGYLWLAVNDEMVRLEKNFTIEGNKNVFMDTLASIARSHNRDERWEAGVKTTADDKKGDKPSCPWGVKKALFQGFYGHPYINCPEAQPLSPEIILARMIDWLVKRKEKESDPDNIIDKLDILSVSELEKLRDELIDFYDPDYKGKEEENWLLSISREQRDSFIANAKRWFSAKRIEEKHVPPLIPNSLGSDEYSTHPCGNYIELIEHLANNPIPSFSQYLMTEYLLQRIECIKAAEAKSAIEPMVEGSSPVYTPNRNASLQAIPDSEANDDDIDHQNSRGLWWYII